MAQLEQHGRSSEVYPHRFERTMTLPEFVEKFGHLEKGQELPEVSVSVTGRLLSKRNSSKSLIFYDLRGDGARLQIKAERQQYRGQEGIGFDEAHALLRRGDLVGVQGFPCRTPRGELSIVPRETIKLLSPCLHMLPKEWFGVQDTDLRYRQRYLDLILNPQARHNFEVRASKASVDWSEIVGSMSDHPTSFERGSFVIFVGSWTSEATWRWRLR
jgi:lysyl-tRNA synthetase class 2